MSSSAVTLGRHSGAAVIGQPLDVRVQVVLAPGEDLANQCLSADVYYGDAQVSRGLVRTTPQKSAPDATASVRIQAPTAINEPIVTVYVRAGCDTAFTRRFVLLADPLTEAQSPAPAPSSAPSPSSSSRAPAVLPPAQPSVAASGAGSAPAVGAAGSAGTAPVRPPANRQAAAAPAGTPAARPPSVVRRPAAPKPAPAAPRLQLDPLDMNLGIERDPTLRLSPLLLSEPGEPTPEARAAAVLLWKAVNASPEDILNDARKLAALETEAGLLRADTTQAQARINELSAQIAQEREQRYRNWLVYLLGGLLLLALLALLVVSRRRPLQQASEASRAWWSPGPAGKAVPDVPASGVRKGAQMPTAAQRKRSQDAAADVDLNLEDQDVSLDSTPAVLGDDVGRAAAGEQVPGLNTRDRKEFSPSALGVSRSVAAEELFDVQQQADFFVSLGEDEQAIQVLRNHLAESHEPSPLAYLDLFKLYHRLGRRDEYNTLRDEFNHVFNAGAPPFHHYADVGRGLEGYESAFSRIQALWPEPRVLDLIEESIFRNANDDQVEVFDLEAYRELLLLHAIAKELIQREGAVPRESRQSEFRNTSMQPLRTQSRLLGGDASVFGADARNTQPMPLEAGYVPSSSRLGLDINLEDLSAFSAFEASLPEVDPPVEPAVRQGGLMASDADGNLIDFEVLDFMPPDDNEEPPAKPGPRH